ncbi:MAG TPA: hypothetical protein VJI66_00770 [Candidatus Paceibacterota bacterium]
MKTIISALMCSVAHLAFSAVVSTNNTNQVRMHIPSYLTNYHSPKGDSFSERAKDEWEQRLDRLSADYLHHFDVNMRWLRYENYDDFERSMNRKGKALIRKPIEYGLREVIAEAPIIYFLGEKSDFLRRFIKNSVGNTSEEEIMPAEITYTTNTITIGTDTNKVSFLRTFWKENVEYGVRPFRMNPYLYSEFKLGPSKQPLAYADFRLHYKEFSFIQYETLVSVPLGKRFIFDFGYRDEIGDDEHDRINFRIHRPFKRFRGRFFVGFSKAEHQFYYFGLEIGE